jgi:3-methyladenine DNA glycosylase/8-oxoguanine DNA glycosylase
VTVKGASVLTGRLVERYGERLDLNLPAGLTHLFPTPERIAEADDIAAIGMPAARARSLRAFARCYADGALRLEGMAGLDCLIAALMEVPGVGPWTAHLMAARVFGHPDAFPASDLGLRRSAGRLLGRSEPPSVTELEGLADRWRPHRSTAAAHLWFAGGSSNEGGGA